MNLSVMLNHIKMWLKQEKEEERNAIITEYYSYTQEIYLTTKQSKKERNQLTVHINI